jgi:hypothetical protein
MSICGTNLYVGEVNDASELEAERLANAIMADGPEVTGWSLSRIGIGPILHRRCSCGGPASSEEECDECRGGHILQRQATDARGLAVIAPVVNDALRSPGQSLDAATQAFFEPRLGRNLSHVRIHTGKLAAESARSVGALAFTVGNDIVFGAEQYKPGSIAGKRLLAHELAHVLQSGRADAKNRVVRRAPGPSEDGRESVPATASEANRGSQGACVVRLGGCPQSRDGGLPSTEEIAGYNKQCRSETGYTGPDVTPTTDECSHLPLIPLSTAEKILIGAFLVTAGAVAATAVGVVGAELVPIVIASIGESATAAYAFYLANAIAINDIGLFAAGVLMACEGNVVGLLKAIADDPTQAIPLLAEVYQLHVNIKVANQPARAATVPAKLVPPSEQTEPQKVKFKTVGAPTFEETTETETSPASAAPKPVGGAVKGIGPAYATLEEVDALIAGGQLRKDAHVLGVLVKDPSGKIVDRWYEVSERGVGTKADPLLGHTEQKALARIRGMNLKPGATVEFVGSLQPCNLPSGCSTRMAEFAQETGIDVRYRYVYGESGTTINDFTPREGRITKGMKESWKH